MTIRVKKLEWEQGELMGEFYIPQTLADLKQKILELDREGRKGNHSFLVAMYFDDDSYLGFTVAEEFSFVDFCPDGTPASASYLVNPNGRREEIIPVFLWTHYTEPDTTQMLPTEDVFNGIFHYLETGKFPPHMQFNQEITNELFVEKPDDEKIL